VCLSQCGRQHHQNLLPFCAQMQLAEQLAAAVAVAAVRAVADCAQGCAMGWPVVEQAGMTQGAEVLPQQGMHLAKAPQTGTDHSILPAANPALPWRWVALPKQAWPAMH